MSEEEIQCIEESMKSSEDSTYNPVTIEEIEWYKSIVRALIAEVRRLKNEV